MDELIEAVEYLLKDATPGNDRTAYVISFEAIANLQKALALSLRQSRELVELFNTPHFLGAPVVGDPITSALDRNAPQPHLSNDTVMVSRDWYEKLSARLNSKGE